jgi:hypothetical protein
VAESVPILEEGLGI